MAVPDKNCCDFNFNLELKCLFSSSGWPQAKSLKFEGQGEKSSWLHVSFLLSCSFFSSPILLTCFWPFQDLELKEGNSLIHKILVWCFGSDHTVSGLCRCWKLISFSRDFHGFLRDLPFPHFCSIKVSSSNSSPAFTTQTPQEAFLIRSKAPPPQLPFPYGLSLVHRKHHLPRLTLGMQLLPHTSVLEISISAAWASQQTCVLQM